MEPQKTLNNQNNSEKKEQSWRYHTDFKLYYRVMTIKLARYRQKNRHTDSRNRTESPETNPRVCGPNIFDKGANNHTMEKRSLSDKWCEENWKATCRRMKLDYSVSQKINSKWIKILNIRPEKVNSIGENIGTELMDLGLRETFMNLIPKGREVKAKIGE